MSLNKIETLFEERKKEAADEKEGTSGRSELIRLGGSFLVSLGYASFSAVQGISPFGVSFVCALPFDYCFSALAGGAFGYLLTMQWQAALKYWSALLLCCLIRLFIHKKTRLRETVLVRSALALVSILPGSAVYLLLSDFTVRGAVLTFCEGVLGFCGVAVFVRGMKALLFTGAESALKLRDGAFAVISLCLLALCVSGYTVKGVSLGRIAVFSAVMLLGFFRGPSAGSVAGICTGAFLSFQPGFSHLFPSLCAGGLASGVASDMGRSFSSMSFCISASVTALLSGADKHTLITAAEAFIAFAVICTVPSERLEGLRGIISRRSFMKDSRTEKQVARVLQSASRNLSQVCELVCATGDRVRGAEAEVTDIASAVKIAELQRALTDQFGTISEYLSGLAETVSDRRIPDRGKGTALKSLLCDSGVRVDEVDYFEDKNGAVTVELTLVDRALDISWKRAAAIISAFAKRSFEKPELQVAQLRTVLTFSQKQPYRLQIGCAQKAAGEGSVCGDTVSAASSVNGHGFALISDGMGTGQGAAADSRLTAAVMKKLVCSGFTFDSGLKIVNSALISRNGEESIASIDALEVDLMSGEAVFYKAGASCSFVRKGECVAVLNKKSLPVGILRGVAFSKARFKARAGDIALLVSDGVAQKQEQWLCDALLSWSGDNMEELSMHILKLAGLKQKGHADDMTVVAVRIEKNI